MEFLCNVTKETLGTEEQAGTLFRGNSLASKALDQVDSLATALCSHLQYMKSVAIPYLHLAIGDCIKQIVEDKHSLEVDNHPLVCLICSLTRLDLEARLTTSSFCLPLCRAC